MEIDVKLLAKVLEVYDIMAEDCSAEMCNFVYNDYNKNNYNRLKKQAREDGFNLSLISKNERCYSCGCKLTQQNTVYLEQEKHNFCFRCVCSIAIMPRLVKTGKERVWEI